MEKNKVGRPAFGVTKKVSITLPEDTWDLITDTGRTKSEFFRGLVRDWLSYNGVSLNDDLDVAELIRKKGNSIK